MEPEATGTVPAGEEARSTPRDLPGWLFFGLLSLVFVLAAGFRLWRIEDPPLWYDEVASWITASKSVPELIRSCQANVHPPLYFLLLKAWMAAFGDGPVSLRLFSALTTFLVMVAGMVLVRTAAPDVPRWRMLYAAILLGTAPLFVFYGRQVRMYALAAFWALTSCWAIVRAQRTGQTGWLVTAGVLAALGCYTHNYLLIHTFFLALYVALVGVRRRYWDWLWAVLLPGFLYLPWVPDLIGQMARVKENYWIDPLSIFLAGRMLAHVWSVTSGPILSTAPSIVGYALTGVTALLVLLKPFPGRWLLVLCSFGVGLAAAAWSILWKPILVWRYLTPAFAVLCCALALATPLQRWVGRMVACLFLLMLVLLHIEFWSEYLPPAGAKDLRDAVAWLRARRKPDEPLVIRSPSIYVPWRYYDRSGKIYMARYRSWEDVPHYHGKPLLEPTDIWDPNILKSCDTVWSAGILAPPPDGPAYLVVDAQNAYRGSVRTSTFVYPLRVQRYIVIPRTAQPRPDITSGAAER